MAVGDGSPTSGGSGDVVVTEDTFTDTGTGVSGQKLPVGKLRKGPNGRDDGDLKWGNPLDVFDGINGAAQQQNLATLQAILFELQSMLDVQPRPIRGHLTVTGSLLVTQKSTTAMAANTSRVGAYFINDDSSNDTVFLFFGPGVASDAASTSVSGNCVQIEPGGYYELPQPVHIGPIQAVWGAAGTTGYLNMTEISGSP